MVLAIFTFTINVHWSRESVLVEHVAQHGFSSCELRGGAVWLNVKFLGNFLVRVSLDHCHFKHLAVAFGQVVDELHELFLGERRVGSCVAFGVKISIA